VTDQNDPPLSWAQGDTEASFGQIVAGRQPQATQTPTDDALDYALKLKGPQPPSPEADAAPREITYGDNSPTGIRSTPATHDVEPTEKPETQGRQPDLPIFDRVMKARKAGYSWQDINSELNAGALRAAAGGYNQQEIDQELGYKQETGFSGFKEAMDLAAKQVAGLEPGKGPDPKGFLDWLSTGEKMSSYGLYSAIAAGQKGSDVFTAENAPPSWGDDPIGRFAFDLGTGIGDIPAMAMGASLGKGNPVTAAAGAMGYPAYLKSIYTAQLMEGSVKDPVEFAKRVWQGVVEAAPQAAVGAAMGMAGKAAEGALEGSTASPFMKEGAKVTQELGTMALAQAVLDGKWPTLEELIDNVVVLKSMGLATGSDTLIGSRLADAWAKGWGSVKEAATRAMMDPVFRAKILREDPKVPAESSTVSTPHEGEFEVPRTHPADTGGHPGDNFDDAIKVEIKLEGGYVRDTGGRTNFGISENAHPEAWKNGPPSEAQAVAIYKHDYWDKMDLDNKDPAIRLDMMDAGVNEGVGKAEELYRASGGDLGKFRELRKAHYDALVRKNPEKYQKYYNGWMHRLDAIAGGKIPAGSVPHVADSSFSVDDEPVFTPFQDFNQKPLQDRENDFEGERANLREKGQLKPEYGDLDKALKGATDYNAETAPEAIKAATEMGRTDISQAILDRAASERDAAKDKMKAAAPTDKDPGNPAAYIELQRLHDEKQKNVEALAKLSGQVPSPRKQRSLERAQQPALNSQEHPLVKQAQTGDREVDSVVSSAAHEIANAKVNKNFDTPWTASAAEGNDSTVFIGKHVPDELTTTSGKKFSTTEPVIIHELVEKHAMEKLIAAGWSKQEAYEVAHYAFADAAENAYYRSIGIDPKEAEAAWKPIIDMELTEKGPQPPHAYRDTGQFSPGSHAAHDDQTVVPSPEKIAQAKTIIEDDTLALKSNRNTTGRGKLSSVNPLNSSPTSFEEAMSTVRQHVVRGDHQATLTEKMSAYAYKAWIELFEDRAPIRRLVEMINRGRLDKGRSPLEDAANPLFLRRLADNAPSVLAKVAIDHGMVKFHRDEVTGKLTGRIVMTGTKGLGEIMGNKSFGSEQTRNEFEAYMVSRWALEKAKQGKTTGVPKDAAQMVVDHIENTGKFIPTETMMNVANRLGVKVIHHDLNDPNDPYVQKMQALGPHYRPSTNEVHMWGGNWPYEKTYGPEMTHDVVFAHEIGHVVAAHLGKLKGVPAVKLSELADQLSIASHRFKPGLWEKFRSKADQRYFNSDQELIADALATWIQDPVARNRLSALKDILPDVEKFGKAPGEDWGNEHMRRFDDLVDYQNRTFQLLRDAGVIDNKLFIEAVADNSARIPGYRAQEDMDEQARLNGDIVPERGFGHTGTARPSHIAFNPIRSFRGSEFRLDNIMAGLGREIFSRTKMAMENYANQSLVAAASEIEGVVQQKPTATVVPMSLADIGKLSQPGPTGKNDDGSIGFMLTGHNITEDEIPVYFNGKRTIWKFADKEVPRLLKGLNEHELNIVQKVMRPIVRVMRTGIIANPAFAVRLFAYDIPWQFITKPGFRNTLADVLVGMKAAWGKKGEDYERFLLSSAAERVFDGGSQAEYLKEKFKTGGDFAENMNIPNAATDPRKAFEVFMRAATLPWRAGAKLTGFVSEAQRVGRFKRGLDEGESDLRAGAMGSDAPFHRAGNSGPTTRMLNSMQPFVQAHLNSMEKIVRGQFGIGSDIGGEKYDAVNFTLKALAAITLPAMTNWAISHNEDWYKEAPDWQKDNGLLFRIGEHTFYIPFPPLLGAIYGGMFKRAASAFIDHDPHAFDHLGTSLGMALLPPGVGFSSNVAVPLIEAYANHSFFKDAPLEGQAQLGHEPHMRATPFTTGFAKVIARGLYSITGGAFDLSPVIVDHLVQGYGGTMGTILTRDTEMALRSAGILRPPPIPYRIEDWAGISSFFERYPSAYSTSTRSMLDRITAEKQIHSDMIKALVTGDFEGFKEIVDKHPVEATSRALKLTKKQEEVASSLGHDQGQFYDYWHDAEDKMTDQDRENAGNIQQAVKAIDVLRQEVANNEALASTGKLKGSDALQIRDQHYLAISSIARDTIKLMDQSRWK
jgi:hypothetical protein